MNDRNHLATVVICLTAKTGQEIGSVMWAVHFMTMVASVMVISQRLPVNSGLNYLPGSFWDPKNQFKSVYQKGKAVK